MAGACGSAFLGSAAAHLTPLRDTMGLSTLVCLVLLPDCASILQARILEWVVMPSSKDLPDPGIKPALAGSCIGRWVPYHQCHQGSPNDLLTTSHFIEARWPVQGHISSWSGSQRQDPFRVFQCQPWALLPPVGPGATQFGTSYSDSG